MIGWYIAAGVFLFAMFGIPLYFALIGIRVHIREKGAGRLARDSAKFVLAVPPMLVYGALVAVAVIAPLAVAAWLAGRLFAQ